MALVRERDYTVSEVAKFLRRDQANVSMMLLRASAREQNQL
jgi:transcriptional regulator